MSGVRRLARTWRLQSCLGLTLAFLILTGCGGVGHHSSKGFVNTPPVHYVLNSEASGVSEVVNNIANLTVVSKHANVFKAEYQAGFVQGHLQASMLADERDNELYLSAGYSVPTAEELAIANQILNVNFNYLIDYIESSPDSATSQGLARLLYRMVGIYHGATRPRPAEDLTFTASALPDATYFSSQELTSGYRTPGLTFMDVYFLNASADLGDVFGYSGLAADSGAAARWASSSLAHSHCTSFVKRTGSDIIIAHNTWTSYTIKSITTTINVNGDMVTMNTTPGAIWSGTDFGYNNKGMMFAETSNARNAGEARMDGIFMFLRAGLAEYLSASLDDFFNYISVDNTGTYLSAYTLVDAKTRETGIVDMSDKNFVFFRSNGGPYTVTTLPEGGSTAYETRMVTPDYILGYNLPPSLLVQNDLQSEAVYTGRVEQLEKQVPAVVDAETAKATIAYYASGVFDSIAGRLDLAPADNPEPPSPFGSVDAKVATASMLRSFESLSGNIDMNSSAQGFWMLYGTPHADGMPFIWSKSQFSAYPHPGIPDAVDGTFTLMNMYLQ